MLFNSYEFIFIFLPITFLVYFGLNRYGNFKTANIFLVLSSLFFYGFWNYLYVPLILVSMIGNYSIGNFISNRPHRKSFLVIGILLNIAVLGYFKYLDFFIININFLTNSSFSLLHLALPLAISFFTFQQIAYLVDSYNGKTREYSFINYVVFVSFFPQLIAGPIVHHSEIMPQFADSDNKKINFKNISLGIFIFTIGLFKKLAIADSFAKWANNGFDRAEILTFIESWITSISYTFQLYFDFSGYCDMAIGIALFFNIKLPINFNSPYKAKNIQDFWRRWHITLGRFLRDYVYIPLGGHGGGGGLLVYRNLFLTFLVGGIWHGANYTFIIWGCLHGIAIVIHRAWQELGFKLNAVLSWFVTFNFVNFTWVFFRAKDLEDALKVLEGMSGLSGFVLPTFLGERLQFLANYGVKFGGFIVNIDGNLYMFFYLIFGFILIFCKNSYELAMKFSPTRSILFFNLLILLYSLAIITEHSEFLYFNF